MKLDQKSVLNISEVPKSRSTIRRHYLHWRQSNSLPHRCDNTHCYFYTNQLSWNAKLLPLILDHISGNTRDNRPENLRLLCPNCDSQSLDTRGGANAGRIEAFPGGSYHVRGKDGRQDAVAVGCFASAEVFPLTGSPKAGTGKVLP